MNFIVLLIFIGFNGILAQAGNDTTTNSPTTTPKTPKDSFYRITNDNTTCIIIDGEFTLVVVYDIAENKTSKVHAKVPKLSDDVKVDGSCAVENQFIKIMWGETIPQNSFHMKFSSSQNGTMWRIKSLVIETSLAGSQFPNASNEGKALFSTVYLETLPSEVPVNHSYKCFTRTIGTNITTTMDKESYTDSVVLEMDGVHIEAFNRIPYELDFVDGVHCAQDEIADIVPIAVGVALAILVLIVLVAYLVGRKRRASSYQSV